MKSQLCCFRDQDVPLDFLFVLIEYKYNTWTLLYTHDTIIIVGASRCTYLLALEHRTHTVESNRTMFRCIRPMSLIEKKIHIGRNVRKTSSSSNVPPDKRAWLSVCLAWYSTKLDTHPITVKCMSSGFLAGAGDMICQFLTYDNNNGNNHSDDDDKSRAQGKSWDMSRTGRFTCLGALWVGPVLHYWYGSLALLSTKVWFRLTMDQFVFSPVFVTSFLSWLWLWEGEPPPSLPWKLKDHVPSIVVANWILWIPAQAVNFSLIPVKYQVLFSNFVALLWNAYLSYSSHNTNKSTTASIDDSSSENNKT